MPDAVPIEPPAEPKKSLFEKLGAGLPVGLTALATVLAGLSTGELNRAMLWRSNAAQDQAKANGQWSLAGFKRDRALICDSTADTLRASDNYREPPAVIRTQEPVGVRRVGDWLRGTEDPPVEDAAVRAVLKALREQQLEPEVLKIARTVDVQKLQAEIAAAVKQEADIEEQFRAEVDAVRTAMSSAIKADKAGATAARYEVDGRRYRAESTANQWVGYLLEVRVKHSTEESDRHRLRSENFFFAMLAAQVGGVVSSLALARKRRSLLWLVAGVTGLVAIGFGAFVYLTM